MLLGFFAYLGIAGTVIPGKVVPGVILSDGTRLHYRCNGSFSHSIHTSHITLYTLSFLCSNGCPDVLNEFFFWLVGFEISGLLTLILLVALLGIGVRMSFISPTVCTL